MAALRELFVEFFAEFDFEGFEEANKETEQLKGNLQGLGAAANRTGRQSTRTSGQVTQVGNAFGTTAVNAGVAANNIGVLGSSMKSTSGAAASGAGAMAGLSSAFTAVTAVAAGALVAILAVVAAVKTYIDTLRTAVSWVVDFTTQMASMGGQLSSVAQRLNLSALELESFRQAAREASLEANVMDQALTDLAEKSGDAAQNRTSEMARTFRRLNVDIRDANGNVRRSGDIFLDVAASLRAMEDENQAVRIANQLMGESGRQLVPLLRDQEISLEQYIEQTRRAQPALQEFIDLSNELGTEQAKLNLAWEGAKQQLFVALAPAVIFITEKLAELIRIINNNKEAQEAIKAALLATAVAFGVVGAAIAAVVAVLLVALLPVITLLLPLILGFAAVIGFLTLAIQDFYVFLRGGDSVFERFIGWLIDLQNQVAQTLQSFVDSDSFIGGFLDSMSDAVNSVIELYNAVASLTGLDTVSRVDIRRRVSESLPTARTTTEQTQFRQRAIEGLRFAAQEQFSGIPGVQPGNFGPNALLAAPTLRAGQMNRTIQVTQQNNQRIEVNEAVNANATREAIQEMINSQSRDIIEVLGTGN